MLHIHTAVSTSSALEEAVYEHCNKNANVALSSMPFPAKTLPPHTKIYKPVLAPSIKRKDDMPNCYDLRIRLCQNGKEDSIDKVNNSHSPTCLADSMRFTLTVSACFSNIVNFFQNAIRDPKDKVCMCLPPYYLEWFNFTYPNTRVTLNKGRLVVQLFNVCQGSTYAGRLLNQHFDRVLGKLGLNRSTWDLAVCARKVDGDLIILNVSTDDVLACTKSPLIRSKVINHLKSYFPLTQKEGTYVKHLNCRIIQSKDHISMDQTCHILKITVSYFKNVKNLSTNTLFRTDRKVDSEIAN